MGEGWFLFSIITHSLMLNSPFQSFIRFLGEEEVEAEVSLFTGVPVSARLASGTKPTISQMVLFSVTCRHAHTHTHTATQSPTVDLLKLFKPSMSIMSSYLALVILVYIFNLNYKLKTVVCWHCNDVK